MAIFQISNYLSTIVFSVIGISECLRKRGFYIQKTSFRVCTDGGCVYTREGVIHQSTNRRNGDIGEETVHVRDDNEQKGTKERKTISEWHNYKAITK